MCDKVILHSKHPNAINTEDVLHTISIPDWMKEEKKRLLRLAFMLASGKDRRWEKKCKAHQVAKCEQANEMEQVVFDVCIR